MFLFFSKLYFKLLALALPAAAVFVFSMQAFPQKAAPKVTKSQTSSKKAAPAASTKKSAKESVAESKRRAEEKKKAEAAARAAAQEKARREQAARQAEARRRAYEQGLRDETVRNISLDESVGEDAEIRRAAVNALGAHAGTIVVMEPQTGKVLAVVNQDWAIRKSFKPCSTIKLVTALAGLNEGLIDENGFVRSQKLKLGLTDALAYSNNSYFQSVGAWLGSEKMIAYARLLGLGQPTGINSADEAAGKLPFGNKNARIYSHGDDFEVTPLQLGVLVSSIANGGKIVVPQIPRSRVQKTSFRGYMSRTVNLPQEDLQGILPGMLGAAVYGTARSGVDSSLGVAGKTGSCTYKGSWIGLFASVAPATDPQFAVIVITRGRNERGRAAAAIAGKIYESLRRRMDSNQGSQKIPLILKPRPKVTAAASEMIDAAAGEDSDDAAPRDAKRAASGKPALNSGPAAASKKGISQELFPAVVIEVKSPTTRPRRVKND